MLYIYIFNKVAIIFTLKLIPSDRVAQGTLDKFERIHIRIQKTREILNRIKHNSIFSYEFIFIITICGRKLDCLS